MSDVPRISVVVPVYRASDCLVELYTRVAAAVESITKDFELVLVDDGSPDASWAGIAALAAQDDRVRGVRLSRNFGQHNAVTAGLAASRGQWVIVMDCDLQDPPEEIPNLYAKAVDEGYPCVMARRAKRHGSSFKQFQSRLFYRVFAYLTDLDYDGAVSNFSISERRVIDDVLSLRESVRYFPGFLFWLGYPTAFVDVEQNPRFAGETSYTFAKLWRHSLDIILSHSNKPLRLCVSVGFGISLLAFLSGIYYLALALGWGYAVSGWASLIISLYFLSGVIMVTLGIVGLYVDKIFSEVKRRPHFIVQTRTFDE